MCKVLVIVESPAKAKTINKYLGKNYVVKSSIGHIRDLPVNRTIIKNRTNLINNKKITKHKTKITNNIIKRMGIDPYNGWIADYQILPGKEKIVSELKNIANKVKHIYLATDLDREGEAIAWHLREIIGGDDKRFSRVTFNEITKNAISNAFAKPKKINIYRVNAQQARRFMDRIVGYMVSPLLWKKIARGLSAGRVQSVAVKLLVERERKIKNFIPQEYWELHVDLLTNQNKHILMQITHQDNFLLNNINYEKIKKIQLNLEKTTFQVINVKNEFIKNKSQAPFITSTLQQVSNTKLNFSVKKTMILAQKLYESGYITYIRTDSTILSNDSIIMARNFITHKFGIKYLSPIPNVFCNKNKSQEAHEAIRPSEINIIADNLNNMGRDAQKLYQLIWNQFIASQMIEAIYKVTKITVMSENYTFQAKEKILFFNGWLRVMSNKDKSTTQNIIPKVEKGDFLILKKIIPSKHFTKAPIRFSESTLVKELEKKSIGRPSTYSSIISTIQDRGYVKLCNKKFYAEKMGEIVTDNLEKNFSNLMDYSFTAQMEDNLDKIAKNILDWKIILDNFFSNFSKQLEQAEKKPEDGGMNANKIILTSIKCPNCSRKMGIRTAITGVFLSCSGYSILPKKLCKQTINLIPENKFFESIKNNDNHDNNEINNLRISKRCHLCYTAMDSYIINYKNKLYICGNNPTCEGYHIEEGNFLINQNNVKIIICEKCNSKMSFKIGRFGKYMACTKNECKNTRKILNNGDIAPPKDDPILLPELLCKKSNAYFVLRNGLSGVFLAANNFPKSRETRAPLVEELQKFKNRLPEKLKYLAEAPSHDPEGYKTLLCFNRKTKQQYITSKKEGKSTGWFAFYINGKWINSKIK